MYQFTEDLTKRYLIAKAEGGIDLADSGPNRIITENGYVDIANKRLEHWLK